MCTPVTPAVPYLLLGLQDVQGAVGNSRGARKLARTPHVNQKKKHTSHIKITRQPITLSCEKKDLKKKKHFLGCAMTDNLSRYDIQCSVRRCSSHGEQKSVASHGILINLSVCSSKILKMSNIHQ